MHNIFEMPTKMKRFQTISVKNNSQLIKKFLTTFCQLTIHCKLAESKQKLNKHKSQVVKVIREMKVGKDAGPSEV